MHWKITPTILAAAMVLVSTAWLGACGKKEEVARAPAPEVQPAPAPPPSAPPPSAPPPTAAEPPPAAAEAPPAPAPVRPSPPVATLPASKCVAADLAPFPWPHPPQPSVTAIVPPYLLFGPDGKATTLMAVAARLEGAIARSGYLQPKYLSAGCDGFAIVLDLESIDADGTRKSGTAGFAPPSQDEGFSLASYIERLFYAPPGHYRQIVFVVSDERMAQVTAPPTEAQLRAIARDGISSLPPAFASVPYTPKHVVLALIYEFEKGQRDGDAKVIPPDGRLGATVHLMKAHLF